MKILIYSFTYSPTVGGVQHVLDNLVSRLVKKNEVKVITSYNPNTLNPKTFKDKIKNYLKVSNERDKESVQITEHFMSIPRSIVGFVIFPVRYILSLLIILDEIARFDPDVINYHFPNDNIYQFYVVQKVFSKKKVVLNIHGNELHKFSQNPIYKIFLNIVITKAQHVVVNSEFMKKELARLYKSSKIKVSIIKNGVEKTPIATNFDITFKPNSYYLYVGRFDYKKNLRLLIEAFNEFADQTTKNLVVIGDGDQTYSLKEIKKLSKTEKIVFLGQIPNDKVHTYFKNAYFTIFPSLYEPFGIVALESINAGTPAIVSSGSGFEEIINETNAGLVFKNNSVSSLVNTLIKVDKDKTIKDKLSKNGKDTIKKYYWSNIIKDYENIFAI